MKRELVIVIDFGGQYNQLVARRVRECNVYCEIYSYKTDLEKIKAMNPKGIILTGGLNGQFDLNFIRVNAQQRYYDKLAGVTEPEAKRKIIGEEFIRIFEEEAKKIGAVDFLAQGTIYPDVVESGLGGESAVIKSHHNVGGLPDFVDFKEIIEPLRDLFKDEVRKAGLELGIQYFAALTNMRSVGVMGDFRTYDYAVALRAVKTIDFMTAESAEIPYAVLNKVMNRIINEVKGVNRVFYDLTSKPPGTIEFE